MGKKKKIKVFVVRGFDFVNVYLDGDFKSFRKLIEDYDCGVICREFDTEEERQAYLQGVYDAEGYMECAVVNDEDVKKHPRILKKLCGDY